VKAPLRGAFTQKESQIQARSAIHKNVL
jgi:hypothetical protein